jgi:hypothetical protein
MNRSRGPNGKSKQARCWLTLISRGGEGEAKKEAQKIRPNYFLDCFFLKFACLIIIRVPMFFSIVASGDLLKIKHNILIRDVPDPDPSVIKQK